MAVTFPDEARVEESRSTVEESVWTDEYWLRHCEGYRAYGPEGELGYVEEVRLSPEGELEQLVVRGARTVTIAAELVEDIDPPGEVLHVGLIAR